MNMEASRWWLHLAKAGDLKVVVACADIAERERDRIGRKKERKQTTQGRDGRTARRHHTGILRRGV